MSSAIKPSRNGLDPYSFEFPSHCRHAVLIRTSSFELVQREEILCSVFLENLLLLVSKGFMI